MNTDESQRQAGRLTPEQQADFQRLFGHPVTTIADAQQVAAFVLADLMSEPEPTPKQKRRRS
ncbi:MAG: hypothetical protein KDJ28_00585 [Candidatus Competibacteraceae bacterium]|nr:hypothetical protein [Candidatus Competibacteraceae bacterium]